MLISAFSASTFALELASIEPAGASVALGRTASSCSRQALVQAQPEPSQPQQQHHIATTFCSTRYWNVGTAAAQGHRPNMEDACVTDLAMDTHIGMVAVFDGHGGAECAEHCATHLVSALRCTPAFQQGDLPGSLTEAFLELDHQLVQCERAPCVSGTTGTVALLQGPRVVVAGVGDSKAVLLRGGRIVPMTVDHRPNAPDEEARIRSAGGFVHQGRVNACLNVSRALGDAQFKQSPHTPARQQQVSPEPDIREATVSDAANDFLLVCSDGVWNSMRETQVLRFVRQRLLAGLAPEVICHQLCQACMEPCRTAYDNITAILVTFTEDCVKDTAGDEGELAGAALVSLSRGHLCEQSTTAAAPPLPPASLALPRRAKDEEAKEWGVWCQTPASRSAHTIPCGVSPDAAPATPDAQIAPAAVSEDAAPEGALAVGAGAAGSEGKPATAATGACTPRTASCLNRSPFAQD